MADVVDFVRAGAFEPIYPWFVERVVLSGVATAQDVLQFCSRLRDEVDTCFLTCFTDTVVYGSRDIWDAGVWFMFLICKVLMMEWEHLKEVVRDVFLGNRVVNLFLFRFRRLCAWIAFPIRWGFVVFGNVI